MVTNQKPIGIILQEAKLITPGQLEVALYEQKQFEMLLGEILSHHGWISQETADFFVDLWPTMVGQPLQGPIGYYLKLAHLLDEDQIERILQEQQRLGIRFGSVAVLKGWLKEETIDFFVKNIARLPQINCQNSPASALVLPVPRLNVPPNTMGRRSPRILESQEKETYYTHDQQSSLDQQGENNQHYTVVPRKEACDTPRQAAETLILFDNYPGHQESVPNDND